MTARREVGHPGGGERELFMSERGEFSRMQTVITAKSGFGVFPFSCCLLQKSEALRFALTPRRLTCRRCKGSAPGPPALWHQVH